MGAAAFYMAFVRQFGIVPNLLTLTRLFIIPFLVITILDRQFHAAFGLFVIAAISDGCDGLTARLLSQRTRLGEYLDPIADKLLLSTLFLVLTHVNLVPRYVTVLVFSRDLGILLISTLLFATNVLRDFRPSLLGKLNTGIQIVGVTVIMVTQVWPEKHMASIGAVLLKAVAVLAPLSAAQYAWIVIRRISAAEQQTEPGLGD